MAATHPSQTTPPRDVLSTGVYLSGDAGMEIGACYAIARDAGRFQIFGPIDTGQLTVRHEGFLADLTVTAIDDRVLLTRRVGRSSLTIMFCTIGGLRGLELERALAPAESSERPS